MELNLRRWSGDNGRQKCKRLFESGKKKKKTNKKIKKGRKVLRRQDKSCMWTWQRGQKEDEKKIALTSISQSFSLALAPNKEF